MTDSDTQNKQTTAQAAALENISSIPRNAEGPVFSEPWQAEVFAMTLSLHEQGVFTWKEWAARLSSEIAAAQANGDPDLGDTYYEHWLASLEAIVISKHIADRESLQFLYSAWETAAQNTPHGKAIEIEQS